MITMINGKKINIVFMGTPAISAYVLAAMIEDGFNIVGVIAQPDKPQGRDGQVIKVPTKKVAEANNIPVFQPLKIRKEFEFVNDLKPDLIVTLAYGQIIPQALIDIPKYGCVNLHGSLLPKYRGAAPIQYALIDGEKETGMSLMEMTKEMDAGDVFDVEKVKIEDDDNSTTLFEKMAEAAKVMILRDVEPLINGELKRVPQDVTKVTFCPTIKPEEEKLNFELNVVNVLGWVRALAEKPGAYFFIDDVKYKVYKAEIYSNDFGSHQIGEIVKADKNGLVIQCKDGQLGILEIQKEGKKRMDYRSFLNGNQNLLNKIAK